MTFARQLAQALRAARKRARLSQAQVAEHLGVTAQTVRNAEAARVMPRGDLVDRWLLLSGSTIQLVESPREQHRAP